MPPRRRKPPRAGALSDLPPLKIIRTILLLQFCYYAAAVTLILFTSLVMGQSFTTALVLDWNSVRGDTSMGWTIGLLWLLTSFVTVVPILIFVIRSKLVPDFALTIHLIHLIISSIYAKSIPVNLLWWSLQTASAFLMVSLGVWACRYRELKPISFGTIPPVRKNTDLPANGSADPADDNIRGGSWRGRSANSGPSYEMVNMTGDENV